MHDKGLIGLLIIENILCLGEPRSDRRELAHGQGADRSINRTGILKDGLALHWRVVIINMHMGVITMCKVK